MRFNRSSRRNPLIGIPGQKPSSLLHIFTGLLHSGRERETTTHVQPYLLGESGMVRRVVIACALPSDWHGFMLISLVTSTTTSTRVPCGGTSVVVERFVQVETSRHSGFPWVTSIVVYHNLVCSRCFRLPSIVVSSGYFADDVCFIVSALRRAVRFHRHQVRSIPMPSLFSFGIFAAIYETISYSSVSVFTEVKASSLNSIAGVTVLIETACVSN